MSQTGEQAIATGELLLGKYRVEETIGRGGMGIVVRAVHVGLDEQVAIKLLRDDVAIDEETIARFLREAQAAVKLKSEHIARISDVGRFDDGKPYMVMEFLQGADIGQMIDQHGFIQPRMAVDLLLQACDALAEAHSIGIVHRDVKPSNLFVTFRPDGTAILKVLDFGISKTAATDMALTQTQSMLGTPAYMSPEQMRSARKVDARTDIWSLGSVLYEAVEGHLPFAAESFSEMCVKVAVDQPTPMVRMPPELQAIVMRCLAKHPDARYPSVAELAHELIQHSSEPHRSKLMVDRMFRTLGRRGVHTPMTETSGAGIPVYMDQSVVMTGPLPASHSQTPPRGTPMPTMNVGPAAPKAKWWIVAIPVVLAGIVGAAVVASTRGDSGSGSADVNGITGSDGSRDGTTGSAGGAGVGGTAGSGTSGGSSGSNAATAGGTGVGGTAAGSDGTSGGSNGTTAGTTGTAVGSGGDGATGSNGTTGVGGTGVSGSNGHGKGNTTAGTGGRTTGLTGGRNTGSGRPATGSGSAKTVPATGGSATPSTGSAKPCDPFTSRTACK